MSGVRHSGGDIDVQSGTGFSATKDKITPIVQMTVETTLGEKATIHLLPQEARAVGLDLIAAASQSLGDTTLRRLARERGEDGDALVQRLRRTTSEWLGEG
ncbi:MAG TPA: hypothetical protein VFW03_09165 [Gemmatimonadaceae bacterium]|nr:hypothetical protein [Gemmatimonadaceae bacterium]